jgi:YHS domain-containing protein
MTARHYQWIRTAGAGGSVLVCLSLVLGAPAQLFAQTPCVGPKPCTPNVKDFGYFRTMWRQFPGEPKPPEQVLPAAIGAGVIPTPPAQEEVPPPAATPLPTPPPVNGGALPETVLPFGPPKASSTQSDQLPATPLPPTVPSATPAPAGTKPASPVLPPSKESKTEGGMPGLTPPETPWPGEMPSAKPAPSAKPTPLSDEKSIAPTMPKTEPKPASPDNPLRTEKSVVPEKLLSPEKAEVPKIPNILDEIQGPKVVAPDKSPGVEKVVPPPKPQVKPQVKPSVPSEDEDLVPEIPKKPSLKGSSDTEEGPQFPTRRSHNRAVDQTASGIVAPEGRMTQAETRQPMVLQADWNSALSPETMQGGAIRQVSWVSETPSSVRPVLGGFCPVQLCDHEQWVAGNPRLALVYDGRTYLFSGPAERQRFLATPQRYVPACSGNDPVAAVEEGRSAPGSLSYCAIWNGRLYLFASAQTLATFREEPARYAKPDR